MGEIAVGFHGTASRTSHRRDARDARRIIARNQGVRPRRVRPPQASMRLAEECPSGVALWCSISGQEVWYRLQGCFNVPAQVNCWLYPCAAISPSFDEFLSQLAGYEIEIGVFPDAGGLTRRLQVTIYDPDIPDHDGTDLWLGSADCVVEPGGTAVPPRRQRYAGTLTLRGHQGQALRTR